MNDKICLITGANAGIGKVTARELAKQGAHVVMVCRSPERGEAAKKEIEQSATGTVDLLLADMSSQASIRSLATQFLASYDRLDVLVNNAGAVFMERMESEDGLEMTFALNHVGYFLLTQLLLDRLKASAPARIVNVASLAHTTGKIQFDDLQAQQSFSGMGVYSNSKLANILFTNELAKRLEGSGVTANSLHPGFVDSNFGENNGRLMQLVMPIIKKGFAINEDKGAQTSIYLASSPDVEGVSGKYFVRKKIARPSKAARNDSTAAQLWDATEKLLA